MYIVSKMFYDETYRRFNLDRDEYIRFFEYLLFPFYDIDTQEIIIPAKLLSVIQGCGNWNTNYSAISFLQEFKRNVLKDLEWSNWTDNKSRRVTNIGFDAEYQELLSNELNGNYDASGKVWFRTGNKITKQSIIDNRQEKKLKALTELNNNVHNDDMAFIGGYLNNTAVNTYTKTINANMTAAKVEATNIVKSLNREARKRELSVFSKTIATLRTLETYPKDNYVAVEGGTSRLFTLGNGLQNLPRRVRKALTTGWIEMDLTAAHTAINAKLWNVREVLDFLASGNSLWKTILSDLQLPNDERMKKVIKESFYTLLYGGKISTVKATFTKGMNVNSYYMDKLPTSDDFMNHWIVKAMLNGRNECIKQIELNRGQYNFYGLWLSTDTYEVNSILSHVATSYELALIKPAFEVALLSDDFVITLYQFDGISISIKDKSKMQRVINKIISAVNTKANTLGIPTAIEYEVL